eukprot:4505743-Amphidinium_carterae.1
MSVVKACCRQVEPQVEESHQVAFKWHHAYNMESQMICSNCARKQSCVAVEGKKHTRYQHQAVLLLASLVPCQPGACKRSIQGQGFSFQPGHCQNEAANSTREEHDE